MGMPGPDEPVVSYSVREMFERLTTATERIDNKLDNKVDKADLAAIHAQLAGKASKADLSAIEARLESHGRDIGNLKDRQRQDEAAAQAIKAVDAQRRDWRRWAGGVAAVLAASGVGALIDAVAH